MKAQIKYDAEMPFSLLSMKKPDSVAQMKISPVWIWTKSNPQGVIYTQTFPRQWRRTLSKREETSALALGDELCLCLH